jgi:hypothetical protein
MNLSNLSPDVQALATAGLAYLTHLFVAWLRRRAPARVAEVTRWAQLAAREAHARGLDWEPIFAELASHLRLTPDELELAKRVVRELYAAFAREDLAKLVVATAKVAATFPQGGLVSAPSGGTSPVASGSGGGA